MAWKAYEVTARNVLNTKVNFAINANSKNQFKHLTYKELKFKKCQNALFMTCKNAFGVFWALEICKLDIYIWINFRCQTYKNVYYRMGTSQLLSRMSSMQFWQIFCRYTQRTGISHAVSFLVSFEDALYWRIRYTCLKSALESSALNRITCFNHSASDLFCKYVPRYRIIRKENLFIYL